MRVPPRASPRALLTPRGSRRGRVLERDDVHHPVATRALERQLLEVFVRVESANGRYALPRAVWAKLPGQYVIVERSLQDLGQTPAQLGIGHRDDGLNAAIQVARHEVGRAKVVLGILPVAEGEDARVLQETSDDRAHLDPFRHPDYSRTQRAHAADDEIDLSARLRGRIERLDDFGIDQVVDLDGDTAAWLSLALDQLRDACAQAGRSDQELAVAMLAAVAGQQVEQLGDIGANVRVGRKKAHVLIAMRGARVVVAGADVKVVLDVLPLSPHDERDLGVGL